MGSGHQHHLPTGDGEEDLRIDRFAIGALYGVAGVIALAAVVAMVLLWPSSGATSALASPTNTGLVDGEVASVVPAPCQGFGSDPGVQPNRPVKCATLIVRVHEGAEAGELFELPALEVDPDAPLGVGEPVVLSRSEAPGMGVVYNYQDRQRMPALLRLLALFVLAVIVLGRIRGVAALAGLGASLAVLVVFTMPALIEGSSPLAVACVTAVVIAVLAIYLAHGVTAISTAALVGTLGALLVTIVLSLVFVAAGQFTGITSDEAVYLQFSGAIFDFRGLLLAGFVIGALGAVDDMTVTQASTVWELRRANPAMPTGDLFRSALRVGRDHVASTVNTLVLAYAGASMPLLLLFSASNDTVVHIANSEIVAVEIVRALVGSIGLVVAVPLTTFLAIMVVNRSVVPDQEPAADDGNGSAER